MIETWVLTNLAIFLAYLFMCCAVAPILPYSLRTRWLGVIFFATCGLTHLELAIHAYQGIGPMREHWHAIIVHIVQAAAVWGFVLSLYDDLRRGRTYFRR